MFTNFELPAKKFELGDKVRHVYIDECENGSYEAETYVLDGQIVGYQLQDQLWMNGCNSGIYLNHLEWVYAVIWEDESHAGEHRTYTAFSHFPENELNKIDSSEPQPILNFSALKGKFTFSDVRRNLDGFIEVVSQK